MFVLASGTISTNLRQLRASCDADKTCLFLRLVAKMSDRFPEQRIDIKYCVKLGKNASDTCAVLYEALKGEAVKSQVFLSDINDSNIVARMWKMMKTMLITFFDKGYSSL